MTAKLITILPLFLGGILFSQHQADSIQFKNISDEILTNGLAYENLRDLTKNIGHRLSGSPELVPDSQRYFEIHHSEEDTFDKVNHRELHLGAVVMGQLIYMIDKNW